MAASKPWAMIAGGAAVAVSIAGLAVWRASTHPTVIANGSSEERPAVLPVAPSSPQVSAKSTPVPAMRAAAPAVAPTSPAPAAVAAVPPTFDVVRIEPTGEAVVAGRAEPNSKVALLDGGKVVTETTADADGNFVMLPPALKPGSYDLSLRQTAGSKPAVASKQTVAVAVPAKPSGQVVATAAEPGQPSRVIAGPQPGAPALAATTGSPATPRKSASPPDATNTRVTIHSAELENGSGFYATGTAARGARVELYLNGSHLAAVAASPDGGWSIRVRKGLTGGHYTVRADTVGSDGHVAARAEVPFDVPQGSTVQLASAFERSQPAPMIGEGQGPHPDRTASPAPSAADAVIDQVETAIVVTGDNLWQISRTRLGEGHRYTQIYAANAGQIRDPKLIYPGQVFVVPAK